MPISGIVIRLDPGQAAAVRSAVARSPELSFGAERTGALAAVIDAPDYLRHDALLDTLAATPGVCAIDIVFHDFSDTESFDRPPKNRGSQGK